MGDELGRCGTCAAFTRVREDPSLGRVGECALEVIKPPVRATATCARYRPKGAEQAPVRARVAGEPRGRGGRPSPARSPSIDPVVRRLPLPTEIDIDMDIDEFRRVLKQVLGEELGIGDAELGPRWEGGEVILRPGREGVAEKSIPIDSLFHKIVMIRDKLRVLEAKLNSHPSLTAADKIQLQAYITGCYGSLTTFNVLFADKRDHFVGQKGE